MIITISPVDCQHRNILSLLHLFVTESLCLLIPSSIYSSSDFHPLWQPHVCSLYEAVCIWLLHVYMKLHGSLSFSVRYFRKQNTL